MIPTNGSRSAPKRTQPAARPPPPSLSAGPVLCAARAWSWRCDTGLSASTASGVALSRPNVPRCTDGGSPPQHGRSKQRPWYACGAAGVAVAAAGRGSDHGDRDTLPLAQDHAARTGSRAGRQPPAPCPPTGPWPGSASHGSRIPDRRIAGGHQCGHWMYHAGLAEARAQAADRRNARGFCCSRPRPGQHGPSQRGTIRPGSGPMGGHWRRPGPRHLGLARRQRGTRVAGRLRQAHQAAAAAWPDHRLTIAAAALAPAVLALSLLTAPWPAQHLADRRRLAAWDAVWCTVG